MSVRWWSFMLAGRKISWFYKKINWLQGNWCNSVGPTILGLILENKVPLNLKLVNWQDFWHLWFWKTPSSYFLITVFSHCFHISTPKLIKGSYEMGKKCMCCQYPLMALRNRLFWPWSSQQAVSLSIFSKPVTREEFRIHIL